MSRDNWPVVSEHGRLHLVLGDDAEEATTPISESMQMRQLRERRRQWAKLVLLALLLILAGILAAGCAPEIVAQRVGVHRVTMAPRWRDGWGTCVMKARRR